MSCIQNSKRKTSRSARFVLQAQKRYFTSYYILMHRSRMGDESRYQRVLEGAVYLNNVAVAQIGRREFAAATASLTGALQACREVTNQDELLSCDQGNFPIAHSLDACMILSNNGKHGRSYQVLDHPSSFRECSCNDDLSTSQYLYDNPIHVPPIQEKSMENHEIYRFSLFLGCVSTFNLSLALHLSARDGSSENGSSEDSSIILRKAARLYEICLSFQSQREDSGESGSCLFTLAVVNNLGLIHRRLKQRQSADKCFEFVLSTLMFLVSNGNADDTVRGILVNDLDGFFRNVTTVTQNCKSAPAA